MYICICKAITDKQLQETSKSCSSFDEVCKRLGIGSDCGSCLQDAAIKHNPYLQKSENTQKPK